MTCVAGRVGRRGARWATRTSASLHEGAIRRSASGGSPFLGSDRRNDRPRSGYHVAPVAVRVDLLGFARTVRPRGTLCAFGGHRRRRPVSTDRLRYSCPRRPSPRSRPVGAARGRSTGRTIFREYLNDRTRSRGIGKYRICATWVRFESERVDSLNSHADNQALSGSNSGV